MTAVFLLVALGAGYLAFRSYYRWQETKARFDGMEAELLTLRGKNALLATVQEALQARKFQVCSATPDRVAVPWLAAVYEQGGELQVFDSSRCGTWTPQTIPAGGSPRELSFGSTQAGCDWDGSVVFFAMRFTRTNDAGESQSLNTIGPWQGFDRDCFTIQ
jgi:hypothetical protein